MDEKALQQARDDVTAALARVEASYRSGLRTGSHFRAAAEDRLRHVDTRLRDLAPRVSSDDAAAEAHERYAAERQKLHHLFALESQ